MQDPMRHIKIAPCSARTVLSTNTIISILKKYVDGWFMHIRSHMYYYVNIWFLCFVIAAVCCCIHVCSVTGEISQRKRRRRAKTTELMKLFSNNYLNSPGGFKVQPWISPFYSA